MAMMSPRPVESLLSTEPSLIDLGVFDSFLFGFPLQKLGDVGVDRAD